MQTLPAGTNAYKIITQIRIISYMFHISSRIISEDLQIEPANYHLFYFSIVSIIFVSVLAFSDVF